MILSLALLASAAFAQYKAEPAGAVPSEVSSGVSALLQKQGTKVQSAKGPLYEIWFVNTLPTGPKASEESLTLPEVPHGSLLGVLKVYDKIADRRGDQLKPGVYTLRYSYFPVNGAHQGIAPQRDFLVLLSAAQDQDPKAKYDFAQLTSASEKAAGIPHPYVLSFWKQDTDFTAGFAKMGEKDWVLQTKIGDTPIAIILVGVAEA